ncbi:MAG: Cof-type HAD-IIB family hydrolase [Cyclobacteriaceae bacterium]
MDYKIVFLDIDGTLLNPDHQITEGTARIIQQLTEIRKIPVVLATARPYYGAYFYREELGLDTPMICFNGALILNPDGTHKVSHQIDQDVTHQVAEATDAHGLNLALHDYQASYAVKRDKWITLEEGLTKTKAFIGSIHEIMAQWQQRGGHTANKLMAMGDPDNITKLERHLKSDTTIDLTINISHPSYLEITHPLASKHLAIQHVHEALGFSQNEVVAIGDSFNDLEMIKYAGLGIAMGNAHPDVQAVADRVTLANDEEGVRVMLEELFT